MARDESGDRVYTRDVTPRYLSDLPRGSSAEAEQSINRSKADPALLCANRRIVCEAEFAMALLQDGTGSMTVGVEMHHDKGALISGQLKKHFGDPRLGYGVFTDVTDQYSDNTPIQMCEFVDPFNLEDSLERVWIRSQTGGGNGRESPELLLWLLAHRTSLPNLKFGSCVIISDEGARAQLYDRDLKRHLGGEVEATSIQDVIARLDKLFNGQVYHIHIPYINPGNSGPNEKQIIAEWREFLGEHRVLCMKDYYREVMGASEIPTHLKQTARMGRNCRPVTDVWLGINIIMSGGRTPEQYAEDMKAREQTDERIDTVMDILKVLKSPKTKPEPSINWL
ncbi:TPA: hypothetical protein DF272_02630 [Candidatus Falkowbacteria bacterium]|nr:hypothetical protein [Candidatus Falkowbacteria bacterium]